MFVVRTDSRSLQNNLQNMKSGSNGYVSGIVQLGPLVTDDDSL